MSIPLYCGYCKHFLQDIGICRAKKASAAIDRPQIESVFKIGHVVGIELLIAELIVHDEGGSLLAHVAVVPGFVPAGEQQLPGRIALDEAVVRADGVQVYFFASSTAS